jgi:hypothetical protein
MEEKERLLSVASSRDWDCWLTVRADHFAARKDPGQEARDKEILSKKFGGNCLFCLAFGYKCWECKTEEDEENPPCVGGQDAEVIDLAIKRLEEAGIWK